MRMLPGVALLDDLPCVIDHGIARGQHHRRVVVASANDPAEHALVNLRARHRDLGLPARQAEHAPRVVSVIRAKPAPRSRTSARAGRRAIPIRRADAGAGAGPASVLPRPSSAAARGRASRRDSRRRRSSARRRTRLASPVPRRCGRSLRLGRFVEQHRVERVPLVVEGDGVAELSHVVRARRARDIESGHTHWSQPRVISSIGSP